MNSSRSAQYEILCSSIVDKVRMSSSFFLISSDTFCWFSPSEIEKEKTNPEEDGFKQLAFSC